MLKDLFRLSSAFLLLIIPSYGVSQSSSNNGRVIVSSHELHHDVSRPLRDLAAGQAPAPQPPQEREVDQLKVIPLRPGFKPATEPDTVLQNTISKSSAEAPATLGPVAGLNFEGLGAAIPNFVIVGAPPDTEGAVGATQYVQWVNTSFAVFDKTTGAMTLGPVLGQTLWAGFGGGCETNNDGDPIVNYDKLADRWVFTQFVVRSQPFLQCVAVSTTSDATGTYNRYSFEYSDVDDYPKLAVWSDAYYITFNMFGSLVGPFVGADACAYDRKAMLQGLPALQVCFQQASNVGSLLPADLDGHITPPAGSPNYMVDFDVNSLNLYKFHVDFLTPSNSTFTGPINIPVAPFTPFCPSVRGCVPQPGGDGTKLDSLGDRLMYRLAYRNFGDHESLVVNHSVVADGTIGNSGVRWYEIQNPNGTPVVAQQSTLAPDAGYRWMGSVAMDASGNLAVGYSAVNAGSNPPVFPSIAVATRGAFDPPSTLSAETTIVAGTGSQINGLTRWGDYSAMQVDPVDDCTFWYTSEYLQNTGQFNWNTRIANFKFPGCGAIALSITKSHSGNFTQGQTGRVYTIVVTNLGGKPTDGTTVTVTDTLPAGLTATAIGSADAAWVCTLGTLSCTRNDVLNPGKSYAAITVTVNVAANAPGLVTNTATVTGGGSKDVTDNTANDVTTVIQTGPDPSIALTHVPLVAKQSATYSIIVTNRGLSSTNGSSLTVTDTLPAGLTATAIGSTDATWVCTLGTLSCTRSDSLASNQSYPPVTISVNVGASALSTVVNTASVAGGGDVNSLNNTAIDAANVLALPPGLAFTNPAVPGVPSVALEFKPGAKIAIAGTATGPTFKDFQLQWAEGINPSTGWSSAGITLAGGSAPVTNGPLGTWDTSGITKGDYYSIRLTVDDSGFSNSLVTFIYLEPDLISPHWPIALTLAPLFSSGFQSLPDGAGNQRLFLVTAPSFFSLEPPAYRTFSPDGASQTSTPLTLPSQLNPAAGQLDAFPGGDAVVPDRSSPTSSAPQVQLFHNDNSSVAIQLPNPLNYGFDFQVPVLEDMEGAGQLDFVSLAAFFAGFNGVDHAFLMASRPDGSPLSGNFPMVIPDQEQVLVNTFKARVFVGDLHGDGSKEFVVVAGTSPSTFTLLQFSHDGTPIPWAVPQFNGSFADMILADLDHNGMLETILTVAQNLPSGQAQLTLHVFQPDGTERPGWPINLDQVQQNFVAGQLMVGDLNRDGTEEIIEIHRNGALNVFEPDGSAFPGLPQFFPGVNLDGAAALADIDGDGFPEIIASSYLLLTFNGSPGSPARPSRDGVGSPAGGTSTVQTTVTPEGIVTNSVTTTIPPSQPGDFYTTLFLQAMRRDGTIARSWTLPGANGNQPFTVNAITVGDFNNDGMTDIALTNQTVLGGGIGGFLGGGAALVLTTGTPFNATVNDWPLVHQNPRNTAVMRRAITVSLTSPVGGGTVAGTVPITAFTTGIVQSVQFKIDGANFGAPVTTAPFTIPWDTTQVATGAHQLVAVAADSNGRPVISAPLNVTVIRGSSSTLAVALTAGASSSTYGDSLTFTATVAPNTATGSVVFFDGANPISGAVALSGGSASLTTSALAAGRRIISARYAGDSAVGGSISNTLTEGVTQAPLTITANNATDVYGGPPPAFSGSVTGAKNGDALTPHFSAPITIVLDNGKFLVLSPPGTYPVTPSVTGLAAANYTVTPVNGTLTITPATLTITAPDATRPYGTNNPQFIPTLTGIVPGDNFQFNATSSATPSSPPGKYPVVPFVTGPNISRYIVNSVNGTLTVTQAGSTTGLATSNASAAFGTPVTFTATVASATTGMPTGSVQFLDGATALGTVTLNTQGVAALTTSSLAAGSHSITGRYSGDTNFIGSLSPAVSQQIIAQPDFSIGASPSSTTIRAGGSASFTFTVTPAGGFNQTVNFSCSGLPAESQCTFAPASVTPSGAPVTSVLTITTTAPSAVLGVPPVPRNNLPGVPVENLWFYALVSGALLGMLWIASSARQRGRVRFRLLLLGAGSVAVFLLLATLTSCGGGGGGVRHDPGTPPGTSSVTVNATSGSSSHASSVTLTVTN